MDRLGDGSATPSCPVAFWWLSLLGGLTLLSYASYRQDPVIIVGQAMGLVVYARNLMLRRQGQAPGRKRRRRSPVGPTHEATPAAGPHRINRAESDILQDQS